MNVSITKIKILYHVVIEFSVEAERAALRDLAHVSPREETRLSLWALIQWITFDYKNGSLRERYFLK